MQAVLLIGFSREHGLAVRKWFAEMEPGLKVAPVSPEYLTIGNTGDALEAGIRFATQRPNSWLFCPQSTPPIVLFSGLLYKEMEGVVSLWQEYTGTNVV